MVPKIPFFENIYWLLQLTLCYVELVEILATYRYNSVKYFYILVLQYSFGSGQSRILLNLMLGGHERCFTITLNLMLGG